MQPSHAQRNTCDSEQCFLQGFFTGNDENVNYTAAYWPHGHDQVCFICARCLSVALCVTGPLRKYMRSPLHCDPNRSTAKTITPCDLASLCGTPS